MTTEIPVVQLLVSQVAELPAAVPDPSDLGAIAQFLVDAVLKGQWALVVSLLIMAIVAGLRRWVAPHTVVGKWLQGKLGGLVANFVTSATVSVTGLLLAGEAFSLDFLVKALGLAFGAAGGWSIFKSVAEAIADGKAKAAGTAAASDPDDTTLDA